LIITTYRLLPLLTSKSSGTPGSGNGTDLDPKELPPGLTKDELDPKELPPASAPRRGSQGSDIHTSLLSTGPSEPSQSPRILEGIYTNPLSG